MRKTLATVGLATLALTGCAQTVTVPTDRGFEATIPAHTMEPCRYDDGTGAPCVYVSDERGTGRGTSFVVLEDYDGPMARVTHDQARLLVK